MAQPWRRVAATAAGCAFAIGASVAGGTAAAVTPPDPPWAATVEPISAELADEMRNVSWHPGCPVSISDLRLLTLHHWGFDDQVHRGELVVHVDVADDVVTVFERLFADRFPIRRMDRIEVYGGDDDASMAADNTSAFNCREITSGGAASIHSWGKAIDINPVENPYIKGDEVLPPEGAQYLDRGDVRPGMIVDGDVVVTAFREIGFVWGGDWNTLKDYQHFEAADPARSGAPRRDVVAVPRREESCSPEPPSSDTWTGSEIELVDLATGELNVRVFNRFLLTTDPPVAISPCDAARVLLHLDRPREEWVRTVVDPPESAGTTVTVTLDRLLDDSVAAVRYQLRFERLEDGAIRLASGGWSQRCQPGRGHQDFTNQLCV